MPSYTSHYIGRFAPSPTGPLHFGSLVAAVASYCDAKFHQGKWLLRIEDLDSLREIKGATTQIINALAAFGFEWDGDISYQSQRNAYYQAGFEKLSQLQSIYPCTCSRKEIADSSTALGLEGYLYPKTCLHQLTKQASACAWRIKTPDANIQFFDAIQGAVSQNIGRDIGDFILLRSDNIFAYQLAVVVDDAKQGITHIVRGADLLLSTPRQIYLQQQLEFSTPKYAHIPLICNQNGEKLSKQTLAKPLKIENAQTLLFQALEALNQSPPKKLIKSNIRDIWQWAFINWKINLIPKNGNLSTAEV